MTKKTQEQEKGFKFFEFQEATNNYRATNRIARHFRYERWEALKKIRPYIIKEMGSRSYEILKLRFGLYPEGYLEVGKKMNITRERVRQIEDKFLKIFHIRLK